MKTLILIPAYNEQKNIADVIQEIRSVLPDIHILVVDDCSRDQTRQIASSYDVNIISHIFNLGYGAALETGYLYAVKGQYDFVIQMDGDGQHPASELPKFLELLQNSEADIVIGNRWNGNYSHSFFRRMGQKLFAILVYTLSGFRTNDSTSGFQGLNRRAISFFVSGIFPHDYPDADVILMSRFAGLRIKEVPVKMLMRTNGISMHSGIKPFYYVIKMLLSIFIVCLNKRALRKNLNSVVVAEDL